jgi:hypothetical protein
MKKLVPVFLAMLMFAFGAEALADSRHGDWRGGRDWRGDHGWRGNYGHDRHRHGYRSSFSFVFGAPVYWPPYAYSYYGLYSRPPVIVQQAPVTYVQRDLPAAPAASAYWYYCPDSQSYYPYAQTCPSEWLQVVPQTTPR